MLKNVHSSVRFYCTYLLVSSTHFLHPRIFDYMQPKLVGVLLKSAHHIGVKEHLKILRCYFSTVGLKQEVLMQLSRL